MTDDDIRTVKRIAHLTLGAGADPLRQAREARRVAILTMMGACSRGEPCDELQAEYERADAAFRAARRERDEKLKGR
jgi:hypothetical protein